MTVSEVLPLLMITEVMLLYQSSASVRKMCRLRLSENFMEEGWCWWL
jgi:hypothetical protein